jgi:L-amino acid N-acyltransferase YncA
MTDIFVIRLAKETDAVGALNIYRPFVLNTAITFEYEVPTEEEFGKRISATLKEFPWLVCLRNNEIIGYAYAHKHRFRTAYDWSPESTIYLSNENHRKGIGRTLYTTLFQILKLQGYFNVFAGVCLPNVKSISFHRAMGFEDIGVFKKIGYKNEAWHDTNWFQLSLRDHIINPPTPKKILEIMEDKEFDSILRLANQKLNIG